MKMIKRAEFIIAATPSKISIPEVANTIKFLQNTKKSIMGSVINMIFKGSAQLEEKLEELDVDVLAKIDFDEDYEDAVGNIAKLRQTAFAQKIEEMTKKM